jgi:hypothetical protein
MYEEEELLKPELQRKYVWEKPEASRFIESILLGLPVPSIFLANTQKKKLIIDAFKDYDSCRLVKAFGRKTKMFLDYQIQKKSMKNGEIKPFPIYQTQTKENT